MDSMANSRYENQDKGPTLLISYWVLFGFAMICVLLRALVRIRIIRSVGWDDYLVFLATVSESSPRERVDIGNRWEVDASQGLAIAIASFLVVLVRNGFGRHQIFLRQSQISFIVKFNYIGAAAFVNPSLALSRTSICIFLLKILQGSAARKRMFFLYFNMTLLVLTVGLTIGFIFGQCQPVAKIWNPEVPGKCEYQGALDKVSLFNGGKSPASSINFINRHGVQLCPPGWISLWPLSPSPFSRICRWTGGKSIYCCA